MPGGHREVVHHGQCLDIDRPADRQFSGGVHPVIADVRAEQVAVAEEVQLPGSRADLGMSRHGIVELAAEVIAADRLKILGDLVGQ